MLLLEILEEHLNIIECKKTDATSNKMKMIEWQKISERFNSVNDNLQRDAQALKTLWDNLKKKAKVIITMMNANRYATGGGPIKPIKDDPVIEMVISIIKNKVEGFNNIYDSDTIPLSVESNEISLKLQNNSMAIDLTGYKPVEANHDEIQSKHESSFESSTMAPINGNWEKYSPSLLRTPRAGVLVEDRQDATGEEATSCILPSSPEGRERRKRLMDRKQAANTSRHTSKHISRRRPVLRENEGVALAMAKIKTLEYTLEHAKEEHEAHMRCLRLQELQEEEKLKQEHEKSKQAIIKTKILRKELESN